MCAARCIGHVIGRKVPIVQVEIVGPVLAERVEADVPVNDHPSPSSVRASERLLYYIVDATKDISDQNAITQAILLHIGSPRMCYGGLTLITGNLRDISSINVPNFAGLCLN